MFSERRGQDIEGFWQISLKGPFSSKHQDIEDYTFKLESFLVEKGGNDQIIIIIIIFFVYKIFRTRRLQKTGLESPTRSGSRPTRASQKLISQNWRITS